MVAKDVRRPYSEFSVKGAEGVKAKVTRPGNAVVAQTLRKTRRVDKRRPNFGPMIYKKAFLPAINDNQEKIELAVDGLLERIATRHWEEI